MLQNTHTSRSPLLNGKRAFISFLRQMQYIVFRFLNYFYCSSQSISWKHGTLLSGKDRTGWNNKNILNNIYEIKKHLCFFINGIFLFFLLRSCQSYPLTCVSTFYISKCLRIFSQQCITCP